MKISASIYSKPDTSVETLALELDELAVDFFHIDCVDRPEVFDDIHRIRQVSQTPIDLHLISSSPESYEELIQRHKVEWVCHQYEQLSSPHQLQTNPGFQQGLALVSDTPIDVFDEFQTRCSFVLFMATTPGKSGGSFHPNTFQRIQAFRQKYPDIQIHVDGGVNAEVSFILRNMGVSTVISGSYLLQGKSMASSLLRLKTERCESTYCVEDFMIPLKGTPVMNRGTGSVLEALQLIEQYGHGLVIVIDEQGRLQGLITNADVRRGLLTHANDFNQMTLEHMLNPSPSTVFADQSLRELLRQIKTTPFSVHYLPVVDRDRKVVGLLTFRDLVKGE
ncbi:MAG: CBS domain-containing protein [Bacteroidota bacterium]